MVSFIAGCFFGAFVLFAARTADKSLRELEERIGRKMELKKPIVVDGEDKTMKFISENFEVGDY